MHRSPVPGFNVPGINVPGFNIMDGPSVVLVVATLGCDDATVATRHRKRALSSLCRVASSSRCP
jgi:hypothetical protein